MNAPRFGLVRSGGAPARLIASRPALPRAQGGAASPDSLGLLTLRFSRYAVPYEINSAREGQFIERIAPGAFRRAIAKNGQGLRVQFNHGNDPSIGGQLLGRVISLRDEPGGPVAAVELFDTAFNRDLLPGLQAGVYGSSFKFISRAEHWNDRPQRSEANPNGLRERTIREVHLLEAGPVTWPANPAASASLEPATGRSQGLGPYERRVRLALLGVA